MRNRQEYYRRLNLVRLDGDWEGWLAFFLDGVTTTADEAVATARDLSATVAEDRAHLLAADDVSIAAVRPFELLPKHPVVTVATVVRLLGVANPTAGRAVHTLVHAGVFVETTGRKRDRWYAYERYTERLRVGTDLGVARERGGDASIRRCATIAAPMAPLTASRWRFANDPLACQIVGQGLSDDALETLVVLGDRVDEDERRSWAAERFPADPLRDHKVTALWTAVADGEAWHHRDAWEALLRPDLRRQIYTLCTAQTLPAERRRALDDDLGEALFYLLLGGADRVAGFAELAVRTLETLPPGPVDSLQTYADADVWHTLASCAVGHGEWPDSFDARWPGLGRGARISAFRSALSAPVGPEVWIDLHCARRVAAHLRDGTAEPWSVLVQNRGRARGRLRARLAADVAGMARAAAVVPSVAARTLAAWRRTCWAWVQSQARAHGERDALAGVTPPCPPVDRPRLATDPALRTWLLLAIVRGQYERVRRWVDQGSTGDGDSTFGRLLVALPDHLADAGTEHRRTYHSVRTELHAALPDVLDGLRPTLAVLAQARDADSVRAALAAAWQGDLLRPTARLGSVPARARAALGIDGPVPVPSDEAEA